MFRNVKILSWLVVILLVTNVATVATVFYHSNDEERSSRERVETKVPGDRRTRFFKEELNLSEAQLEPFREANRRFNRRARGIADDMSQLRVEMLDELFADSVSREDLQAIAQRVGVEHRDLKMATCDFYLELKSLCNDEQKDRLAEIFQSLLNSDERVQLPGKKHRQGRPE